MGFCSPPTVDTYTRGAADPLGFVTSVCRSLPRRQESGSLLGAKAATLTHNGKGNLSQRLKTD